MIGHLILFDFIISFRLRKMVIFPNLIWMVKNLNSWIRKSSYVWRRSSKVWSFFFFFFFFLLPLLPLVFFGHEDKSLTQALLKLYSSSTKSINNNNILERSWCSFFLSSSFLFFLFFFLHQSGSIPKSKFPRTHPCGHG